MTASWLWLDMDPGVDDALAIAYLCGRREVTLVGLSSVHGNAPVEVTTDNARALLDAFGQDGVPVFRGAARPLAQEAAFSLEVHGTDGLGGYRHLLPPARPAAEPSGPQALLEASRRHAGALTVLATGPLTNLALALLEDAGLPARVARVVVMGGAFATAGNVTPVAEANFWHDPEAADLVLSAPWPLVAVGLDVTRRVWFGEAELDRLAGAANPAVRHLAAMARAYAEGYGRREGEVRCLLHDPLAALAVVEPEILSGGRAPVRVERRGEHTRGMSVADLRPGAGEPEHGPWLAWGVKAEAARGRLLEGLLGL